MRRLNHPVYRNRLGQILADAALVALAYFLAFQLRFLDDPHGWPHRYEVLFAQSVGFVIAGKLIVFAICGLYQKWWRYVSGRDFVFIGRAVAISSALLVIAFAVIQPFGPRLPRSVEVIDFLFTLILIAGARLLVRLIVERPSKGDRVPKHEVLVVGAGKGGQMVVRELRLNPALGGTAIGFVDDDPRKRGMRMNGGVKVLGSTDEIAPILDETDPDEVIIAIPSAPGTLRAKVVAACRERRIRVRTLPTVFELLRGGVQLSKQLRDVQVEDVLGREPIVIEIDRVGAYLHDKIVLVTGRGRLDRLRALPADRPGRPDAAGAARPRRGQPLRDRARDARRAPLLQRRVGARRLPRAAPDAGDDRSASSPTSSSTPPPTSTCR